MVTIRPATSADVDDVRRIALAAFEIYTPRIGRMPAPAVADHSARVADGLTWVADDDGPVVGYCVLVPHDDHLELDAVAVDPAYAGSGLGRALIAHAEDHALHCGLPEVRLCTHITMTENQTLYPHLGYTETGRGTEHGFERVFYVKRVTSAGP